MIEQTKHLGADCEVFVAPAGTPVHSPDWEKIGVMKSAEVRHRDPDGRRRVERRGVTKNAGNKRDKSKSRTAKASRQRNRGR